MLLKIEKGRVGKSAEGVTTTNAHTGNAADRWEVRWGELYDEIPNRYQNRQQKIN